ncbi:right-handed parallel beta-helix repeat-containing protein [Candidatus Binatia bacterium]|nr:right-handed parallel beta-helix repeat-containing protein [Candidatus Binatia bacterium]
MRRCRRALHVRPSPALVATLALLATVAAAHPARADRFVAVGGDDLLNDCTSSATPCATVPYAAGLATAGEVISVGPGSFAGTVTLAQAVTLRGAQVGVPVASRTAGSAAETIIDARGLASAIVVSSGGVTIEGLDVVGDAQTHTGVLISASADLAGITVRDSFVHGMALANPATPSFHLAHGIFATTGLPGSRNTISGLVIQGNDVSALGSAGSVAGVAVHVATVSGVTAGDGVLVTGNAFRTLATRDAYPNVGSAVIVDFGTDDLLGAPLTPSSGASVTGNTYVGTQAGVIVNATASTVVEPGASFANVPWLVVNVGRHATVDTAALGKYATSNLLTGFVDTTGYFQTIQAAVDASQASAEVRPTAHAFAETVTLSRGIQLLGVRAGEDARTRDVLLGESTVALGIRIRAEGAIVDGVSVTNPGAIAIHADQNAASAVVRNVRAVTARRGIALDRAQSATVVTSLVQDIAEDAIAAGSDADTLVSSDDVVSVALIQDNEVVDANVGANGYMQFSLISRNVFRDYPDIDLGAGIAGALLDSIVEKNTVQSYPRGAGVLLTGDPNRPLTRDTTFRCNSFLGNYFGILIEITQTSADGVLVRGNTISGNAIGALNYPPFLLDATQNWWGCAAGPGHPGCDVAGQNVTFAPFLTAVPDCASCAVDADCDDGLFCNGAETCDQVIDQCLPGTPPTCDLGSADPQCNVATCDQLFGCVAIPVADGTACDLGTTCSVSETCASGTCIAPTGAQDADGDGICNADDGCPNCDFPFAIEKGRVVRDTGGLRHNGKVVAKASFLAPIGSPGELNVAAPIALRVRDGGTLAVDATFQPADCKSRRNIVTCKSSDRRYNLRVKPFRPRDNSGLQILNFTLKALSIGPSFQAPLSIQLRHGAGISRTGSITTCQTAPGLLRCAP